MRSKTSPPLFTKRGGKSGLSKLERLHRFFDALTDKLYFTSEVEWNGGSGDV